MRRRPGRCRRKPTACPEERALLFLCRCCRQARTLFRAQYRFRLAGLLPKSRLSARGGRAANQFFRHENSLGCTAAGPSLTEVQGKAPSRSGPGHAGDNSIVAALRSKPEGEAGLRLSFCENLMLSRLGRCRESPGVTADDAILTRKFLLEQQADRTLIGPRVRRKLPEAGRARIWRKAS